MNAPRSASLVLLAVLGLPLACSEPAGPDRLTPLDVPPAAAVRYDPDGGPLQVHTAVKVEAVDGQSVREVVQVTAYFDGVDPVDPAAPSPGVRELLLELEVDIAGTEEPCWLFVVPGDAWTARGGGFVLEAEGAGVEDVLKAQVETYGQVLDLDIARVEAWLRFRPNLKVWELSLELTGADEPAGSGSPAFAPIAGARLATLRIGAAALESGIRENESGWESDLVAATAGTMIREAGPGEIRELVEVVARFPSDELVPDPALREVEDIRLDFEVDIAGTVQPCWVFLIPGDAWEEGDGGGFKFEDHQPQWLQALVIREGQLLADLTGRIREVEANLTLLDGGIWELRLEIAGEAAPVEQHAPAFSPIAGAATATVVVGNELELLPAGLREAEAVFGTVIPSD